MTFNEIMKEAKKNAVIGGDVLAILRTEEDLSVSVELVDGEHVKNPFGTEGLEEEDKSENVRVRYGVAYDINTKRHLAYYVRKTSGGYTRIPVKDKNNQTQCFLLYGLRYRIDNIRGIPLTTACLQTVAQLDRYKEALVGSAEERAKIVWQIVHDLGSSGEGINTKNIERALNSGLGLYNNEPSITGENLQNLVATTTNKQAVNMPQGAELKSISSQNEMQFGPFVKENIIILCATLQIPYEVAMSKYENNFSSSRAALKDWEHTIHVERDDLGENFCSPIYQYWLNIMVMSRKIDSPTLVTAILTGDVELYEAITNSRWIGRNVPHIDPEKEVRAERLKLGGTGANVPLTTISKATETLGTGEFDENLERYVEEYEQIPEELKVPSETEVEEPEEND